MSAGVASFFDPVARLSTDVLTKLRNSWRFRVAVLIWLPLFITGFVMTVRFGLLNVEAKKYHEWKETFVGQQSMKYPDVLIRPANPNGFVGLPTCVYSDDNAPQQPVAVQAQACPFNQSDPNCYFFRFSSYSSAGVDDWNVNLNCTIVMYPANGGNDILHLWTPGGIVQLPGGTWNQDGWYIRPNKDIVVHFEPADFFPMDGLSFRVWRTRVLYESTEFTSYAPDVTSISVLFRIPITAVRASWETVGFDAWFLMATWGGGYFFFYFLFVAAFSLAKLFLPADRLS